MQVATHLGPVGAVRARPMASGVHARATWMNMDGAPEHSSSPPLRVPAEMQGLMPGGPYFGDERSLSSQRPWVHAVQEIHI